MKSDVQYRAWVDGGCRDTCPGGEDMAAFGRRVCDQLEEVLEQPLEDPIHMVVHGGTIRAILSAFGEPKRPFFDWPVPHCAGYRCRLARREGALVLPEPEALP